MATIYELTDDYRRLLELLEDPDMDPEVLRDTMEGLDGEFELKAENYAKVMTEASAMAAGARAEGERLINRAKSLEENVKRMRATLQGAMELTGKTKFKTDLFSFFVRKNPPALRIDNPAAVPDRFLIPQEPKIDSGAIKQAIKDGDQFDWCHLEQGQSLQIR